MGQLTALELYNYLQKLKNKGIDLDKVQIYLGDDDELNGVHCAFGIDSLDVNDDDSQDIIEMINDRAGNIELVNKGVLIS